MVFLVTLVPRLTTGYSWTLGVGDGGGMGGGSGYKKNRDRILRRNKKNRIRPRSGRKFGVFEVQNAIWEALGSVKASGKGNIFARLRRGLQYVDFLYCDSKCSTPSRDPTVRYIDVVLTGLPGNIAESVFGQLTLIRVVLGRIRLNLVGTRLESVGFSETMCGLSLGV